MYVGLQLRQVCSPSVQQGGVCAELLAESVVWRGCRHDGRAISAAQGLDYLTAGLEAEGRRGVRQLAAVALPLPVPLPFPRAFAAGLSDAGDRVRCRVASGDVSDGPPGCGGLSCL